MKHILAAFVIAVPTSLLSASVMGAAGVVEGQVYQVQAPLGGQSNASNDALVMLLDQFREMRSELETLRGLVEEQGYELRNLQRESRDRYTDLDSRISALSSSAPATPGQNQNFTQPNLPGNGSAQGAIAPTPSQPSGFQSPVADPATAPASAPAAIPSAPAQQAPIQQASVSNSLDAPQIPELRPTMMSEQQQYQAALDSLLQEEQYQRSVNEFDEYLARYPAGRFVTNAWYWKGQAYLNLAMFNEARNSFETIVTQYPDGRKVDDAMYSLGTVYDKLGNPDRARQLLRDVQRRFPNTSAANLADIYLRSMN